MSSIQVPVDKIDVQAAIEEMRRDSGADDLIPVTMRFHGPFYEQISKFCDTTGIKKAVLIRKLCEVGWVVLTEGDENEPEEAA